MKRRRGERLGRLAYVARIPPRRGQQPPTTIASAGAIGLPRDASALPTRVALLLWGSGLAAHLTCRQPWPNMCSITCTARVIVLA